MFHQDFVVVVFFQKKYVVKNTSSEMNQRDMFFFMYQIDFFFNNFMRLNMVNHLLWHITACFTSIFYDGCEKGCTFCQKLHLLLPPKKGDKWRLNVIRISFFFFCRLELLYQEMSTGVPNENYIFSLSGDYILSRQFFWQELGQFVSSRDYGLAGIHNFTLYKIFCNSEIKPFTGSSPCMKGVKKVLVTVKWFQSLVILKEKSQSRRRKK